ncbi:MAG TPA: DUF362 domain-containing protein [Candidatus Ozemobacteraceae bacterium]|nr:DUF362 domain-containing protein [Candidatus Ozemobacteraceae bacterium]
MNRRSFLKWTLAAAGAVGLGAVIGRYWHRRCRVWVLSAPDYRKEYAKDIGSIMLREELALKGKNVLIKPNFVECHPGRPINTEPSLIAQVADACFRLGAASVTVGEAPGHRRDPWFSIYNRTLREALPTQVRCIDLNHGELVRIPNKGWYTGLDAFYVAAPLARADVVISMPKMKTHHWMGVTLSMKNLFGNLPGIVYGWPKNVLHFRGIPHSIVDLALTMPPHFIVVDGIVGMEGDGPILGTPKQMGVLVLGTDPLAVDATAARMMGFDPALIPYMSLALPHLPGMLDDMNDYPAEHPRRFASTFSCIDSFKPWQCGNYWK